MVKKLSLLMLCAFAVPRDTQAMYADLTKKLFFGAMASALSYVALRQGYQWWYPRLLKQELVRNPLILHAACENGDLEKVIGLLAAGASPNALNITGDTPLHKASSWGYKKIVELLIEHGASVNSKDCINSTPLHAASWKGHKEVVELLIKHGASVNSKTDTGCTPLYIASYNGHKGIVELLIKHGACVDSKVNDGCTPLHDASYLGYDEIIKLLVCTSFFPPSASPTPSSLQEQCLTKLLMNLDKDKEYTTKVLIPQLAHLMTVNDTIACILVNQAPLELQQSFVEFFKEHNAQEAINLLVKAHAVRHLKKIQEVLEIQDNNHETARDVAFRKNRHTIVTLLDHLHQTKNFDQLDAALKKSIIENIQRKLLIKPTES